MGEDVVRHCEEAGKPTKQSRKQREDWIAALPVVARNDEKIVLPPRAPRFLRHTRGDLCVRGVEKEGYQKARRTPLSSFPECRQAF
jgi:hypothetical protein